jgi:hypothetical protein
LNTSAWFFSKLELQDEALVASSVALLLARSAYFAGPQFQQRQFQLNEIEQLAMRVVDHLTAQELWEQATMQANDLRKRYSSSVVFEDMPGISRLDIWQLKGTRRSSVKASHRKP